MYFYIIKSTTMHPFCKKSKFIKYLYLYIGFISFFAFLLITSCKTIENKNQNTSGKITVAAYYFPNYHTGDPRNVASKGENWSEWELVKAARPRFPGHLQPNVPAWGYVDEKEPQVMDMKINAAVENGIDCFIFDWYMYEDGPFLNRCIDESFLNAPNNQKIQFALMWANHDWIDIHPYTRSAEKILLYPGKVSPKRFDEIGDFVIQHYFTRPNYLKIDGKP
jgi:hypothetical protein